jgi:hypothetical protein
LKKIFVYFTCLLQIITDLCSFWQVCNRVEYQILIFFSKIDCFSKKFIISYLFLYEQYNMISFNIEKFDYSMEYVKIQPFIMSFHQKARIIFCFYLFFAKFLSTLFRNCLCLLNSFCLSTINGAPSDQNV